MQFSIVPIYEDNHLLVLNKPAGLLTQPSGTSQNSLEQQAKAWIKEVYHKPGNVFLEAIHRLDKPVSGVVIFCKTSKALARLNASIRAKQTRKIYWAWVEGSPSQQEGVIEHYLLHDDFKSQIVTEDHPEGKIARLKYRVLKQRKDHSLLEIELETGRYHQIRRQLSAIGCPIWGDFKYGSRHHYEQDMIALHHQCLQIQHPITKVWMTFEADPPTAFLEL